MCTHIYIYIYLSLSIYIYIYICINTALALYPAIVNARQGRHRPGVCGGGRRPPEAHRGAPSDSQHQHQHQTASTSTNTSKTARQPDSQTASAPAPDSARKRQTAPDSARQRQTASSGRPRPRQLLEQLIVMIIIHINYYCCY